MPKRISNQLVFALFTIKKNIFCDQLFIMKSFLCGTEKNNDKLTLPHCFIDGHIEAAAALK